MIQPAWLVLLPLLGAAVLALIPRQRVAALLNIGLSAAGFLLSLALPALERGPAGLLHLDALNLPLLLLSGLVGLAASVFSAAMLPAEGFGPRAGRAYHAGFQLFLGASHLALLAGDLGLMWVAAGLATLAGVLMVALRRTPAAIGAAWRFLMLGGLGLGLALFGTVVLALAAQPPAGEGVASLSLATLARVAREADPGLMTLAFVFLLVGYGTQAALVPLHAWLPDAQAKAPAVVPVLLSGLLMNVALHTILRAKAVVGLNPGPLPPGALMVALGLASLLLAAFALWRQRDARRLLAWSGIGHVGLASFAFGLGGAASMAGLLHMLGHALVAGAGFMALGRAMALGGGPRVAGLGGLALSHPAPGWTLALCLLALAGLPPFSLFASLFLMAQQSVVRLPWLALPLGLGLLAGALAMLRAAQHLCRGPASAEAPREADPPPLPGAEWMALAPAQLHLLLALILGLALPAPLAALLAEAARIAG